MYFDDFGTSRFVVVVVVTVIADELMLCDLSHRHCAHRFVCRLTVQTPKGEIINQVILYVYICSSVVVFQSANAIRSHFKIQIQCYSFVSFSNCIYFASYNICAGIKLVEIEAKTKGRLKWNKNEGVVRSCNINEIKLAHWEVSFLAIFIFHSSIFFISIHCVSVGRARALPHFSLSFCVQRIVSECR